MSLDINNVMRIREQFNNHASREIEPDPFIWEKYLEYLETGQYPYHSSVVEFIAKGFPELTDEQKDGIHTNSYLCSQKKRKLDRINDIAELLNNGWKQLDLETSKKFNHKKLIVNIKTDGMLGTIKKEQVYKIFVDDKDNAYLMKPRATRTGFLINQFFYVQGGEFPIFYKEIN